MECLLSGLVQVLLTKDNADNAYFFEHGLLQCKPFINFIHFKSSQELSEC